MPGAVEPTSSRRAWIEALGRALERTWFRGGNPLQARRGLCWKTPEVCSGTPGLGVHTGFQSNQSRSWNFRRTFSWSPVVSSLLSCQNNAY